MTRLAAGVALFACASALGAAPARAEEGEGARPLVVDGRVGAALLTRSRSRALAYLIKPDVRLGARLGLLPRLEVGAAASALLVASEHYRVLGLLAHGRFALLAWQRGSLGLSAALGAGYDADILHTDLAADGAVLPYGFLATDLRLQVAGPYTAGVEIGWQNLGMLQLGATVGRTF